MNSVTCEYMIMEEARGTQLGLNWKSMTMSDKFELVQQVVELQKKMLSITFGWRYVPSA